MDITIREINAGDYEAFDALMKQVHGFHVSYRPDMYKAAAHPYGRMEFEAMLLSDNAIALIAESGEEAVGISVVFLSGNPYNPVMVARPVAYMEDLCVRSDCLRQGVGKKLFEYSEKEAKVKGAQRLDLMVWSFNKDAIAFYEEMGMTEQRRFMEKYL